VEYLWNHYLVKMSGGRAILVQQLKIAITFDLTILSRHLLLEFLEAIFSGVPLESVLSEDEGWSCKIRKKAQKGHNF